MPAYNFQHGFALKVERQLKLQTIRAKRKQRPRAGQTAYCFEGLRLPCCRKLGAWTIAAVRDVKILDEGVLVDGGSLEAQDLDGFARADGFADWPAMLDWFRRTHGLPFHGDLVMWSRNAEGQGCRASRHTLDPLVRHSDSGGEA